MANIIFEKLRVHNFLSFGDAEVEFRDKGYTLVSGVNLNPKDGALSNGSGKSSIWSAISWALTGETIQGINTNVCHINFLTEGCWVELTFKLDKDVYKITRYRDFGKKGGDLKIVINNEDRSGDGLRKSEALLAEYLPDVTSSLLGSVIILGQGLPHRFTNNTPAGRKEVLEKLSKSDFMIEDIKARISKRSTELSQKKREFEDALIQQNTQLKIYKDDIIAEQFKLDQLSIVRDFDTEIMVKTQEVNRLQKLLDDTTQKQKELSQEKELVNKALLEVTTECSKELDAETSAYSSARLSIREEILTLTNEQSQLQAEIKKLESIKDICPTCGQKLPHVHVSDTTDLRTALAKNLELHAIIKNKENILLSENTEKTNTINNKYNQQKIALKESLLTLSTSESTITNEIQEHNRNINFLNLTIQKTKTEKENYESNKQQLENRIAALNVSLRTIEEKIVYITTESEKLAVHALAISKMDTLVKRDFRGFLLTNVIDFINIKAKEYCQYVFDSDEIEFSLNGNSIDISYSGKEYENLSGGEKQKVDLIIQFSIRDMLSQQLNFSSNILVLDEITDNLDAKGSERIINLISNKLSDVESVFIITHHTELLQGLFEREIKVEKDRNGVSRIL